MDQFQYRDGHLWAEAAALGDLAARYGTPLYVYSAGTLRGHYRRLAQAFAELDARVCYSVKCCPNTHLLRLLAQCGSGFDVVSGGELYRARLAGAAPEQIVFAGVGKTQREMEEALTGGIGMMNVESESELDQLISVAANLRIVPDVALRITPEVTAGTHAYTTTGTKDTKFGIALELAANLFRQHAASTAIRLRGVHLHIGSPVHQTEPYVVAIRRALDLIDALRRDGVTLDTLDIGGGFAAHYENSEAPAAQDYAAAIVPPLRERGLRIILEPGRCIAANAALLVTRVLHVKDTGQRRFIIVDASMNELIRPALYDAYHFVWPVEAGRRVPTDWRPDQPFDGLIKADVVGPVCESGDFLAKDRPLPPLRTGDLLAVFTCGAYAMAMASQYNSRPRAAEVLVEQGAVRLIRRRETYADLVAAEEIDVP